jgi:glyoxylase-like metal-dependent hydrolase (beta-lactamase superfamily II)
VERDPQTVSGRGPVRVQCLVRRLAALFVGGLVLGLAAGGTPLGAQANPYSDSLLSAVRALARAVPGELPTSVGYLSVQDDSSPASDAVDGAPKTRVLIVTPAFQVRYRQGWIMVDAVFDREGPDSSHAFGAFRRDRFDRIAAALRGARLTVVTHEHVDHVGTLVHSPLAAEVAPRTMLTRAQVETLLSKPKVAGIGVDSALARRFVVIDYERALPIAPGVVLIRAPGHTPGSQMVYVKLASGRELMLAGDIAWLMAGIDMQHQKPDSVSRMLSEDRTPTGQQLAWLKNVVASAGIAIAVSHDGDELRGLARRGLLSEGLDTSAP